jgi:hypothetical protein
LTRRTADRAPCTRSLRRYRFPHLLMQNSLVLPPVECCRGTSPSQEENSRPLWKAAPLPTATSLGIGSRSPLHDRQFQNHFFFEFFTSFPEMRFTVVVWTQRRVSWSHRLASSSCVDSEG